MTTFKPEFTDTELRLVGKILSLPQHPDLKMLELQAEFETKNEAELLQIATTWYDSLIDELSLVKTVSLTTFLKKILLRHIQQTKKYTLQRLQFFRNRRKSQYFIDI